MIMDHDPTTDEPDADAAELAADEAADAREAEAAEQDSVISVPVVDDRENPAVQFEKAKAIEDAQTDAE